MKPTHLVLNILFLLAPAFAVAAANAPNIILFLTDDQGWTGTSVQMDGKREDSKSDFYQTPALERLAEQSMTFSQGYSPHPNCSPTRMTIRPRGVNPALCVKRNPFSNFSNSMI